MPERKHPAHRVIVRADLPTVVFLTVWTKHRQAVLANDRTHRLLVEHWSAATAWLVGRYVIMPDHVHLLIAPGDPELPLTNWVSFWKRAFTRQVGDAIWQEDYWDTTMRDAAPTAETWDYIRQNPVRKGLAQSPDQWPWQGELNPLAWR